MPSATHKKAGVRVITPVIWRSAVIKPIIILAMIENNLQRLEQQQFI